MGHSICRSNTERQVSKYIKLIKQTKGINLKSGFVTSINLYNVLYFKAPVPTILHPTSYDVAFRKWVEEIKKKQQESEYKWWTNFS